jgi:hypothetical protein
VSVGVFRFMSTARMGSFLDGSSFSFGRLRYYRLMEMAYGDRHIGDKREGSRETKVSTKPSDPDHAHVMAQLEPNIQGMTGRLSIAPSVMKHFTDAYVLSCSIGPLDELLEAMRAGHFGPQPYNGCVLITDAEAFARTLWEHGRLTHTGEPVRHLFELMLAGPVTYGDVAPGDVHEGPIEAPDAFSKAAFYAGQREWRTLLRHRAHIPSAVDRVSLTCPEVQQYLQRVAINVPAPPVQEEQEPGYWLEVLRSMRRARPSPPTINVARAYFEYRRFMREPNEEIDQMIELGISTADTLLHYIEKYLLR